MVWQALFGQLCKWFLHKGLEAVVDCGRLGRQREGWDLVSQLGRFAAEAPVPELREKVGYGPVRRGSKVVPSAPFTSTKDPSQEPVV